MRHSLLIRSFTILLLAGLILGLTPNVYASERAVASPSRDGNHSWFSDFFLNLLSTVFGGNLQVSTDGRWGGPTPGSQVSTEGRWGGPTPASQVSTDGRWGGPTPGYVGSAALQ